MHSAVTFDTRSDGFATSTLTSTAARERLMALDYCKIQLRGGVCDADNCNTAPLRNENYPMVSMCRWLRKDNRSSNFLRFSCLRIHRGRCVTKLPYSRSNTAD